MSVILSSLSNNQSFAINKCHLQSKFVIYTENCTYLVLKAIFDYKFGIGRGNGSIFDYNRSSSHHYIVAPPPPSQFAQCFTRLWIMGFILYCSHNQSRDVQPQNIESRKLHKSQTDCMEIIQITCHGKWAKCGHISWKLFTNHRQIALNVNTKL
jgi:hypothetical protein